MTVDSFAAAQARVLARREARQVEEQSRRQAALAALQDSSLTRLPFGLNRTRAPLSSFWTILNNSEGTRPAFRVGQVDSELLDEELLELLKSQASEALKYYGPHLRDDWSEEILLALRGILFKLSVWDHDASYGATLQNLKYTDARQPATALARPSLVQKSLYGIITVFGRYGWEKWESWLRDQEGGYVAPSEMVQTLSRLTAFASTSHAIAAFASFLVFLVRGRYRTLTDRLLRLRLVPASSQVNREVSFEYLNRQLVWHAFTEFLLFLLPLVGISRWRRWLSRAWKRAQTAVRTSGENGENSANLKSGVLAFLPERCCAICYQDQNPAASSEADVLGASAAAGGGGGVIGSATTDVVNPYETNECKCIYCFVCIATRLDAEDGGGWTCLRCGELVYGCRPWAGDVVVESRQPGGEKVKSVGFVDNSDGEDNVSEEQQHEPLDADSFHGESSQWSMMSTNDMGQDDDQENRTPRSSI